jgi:hypothetical protein
MPSKKYFVGGYIARRKIIEEPFEVRDHLYAKTRCRICKNESINRLDHLVAKKYPFRCPDCVKRGFA